MTRHSIFQKLIRLIGRKNTARLQMAVKYVVTFRKVYTADSKTHGNESFISPPRVVFIIDGKTPYGGLSDRLRGLFSIYYYCKQRGYTFKVAWNYPFKLAYIIHSGFISGYQNRYGDNLKPPTNVYHRMTA